MTLFGLQLHPTRRLTFWLLILVCAWMGTGGVLHHTDEETFGSLRSSSYGSIHRVPPTAPVDTCAACEWTQGLVGGSLAVYHVQTPLFLLRPRSLDLTPAPIRRALRRRSSRAPPALLADC